LCCILTPRQTLTPTVYSSSYYLLLGGGYHLIIVKETGCEVENITNLLKTRIPDVEIDQDVGAELSYSLPDNKSSLFPEMFTELENRKTELKIASYGASITTMEEVFIRVGREADQKMADEFERTHSIEEVAAGRAKQLQISLNSVNGSKTNLYSRGSSVRNTGVALVLQQFKAMLAKKCIYSIRNRILLLGQVRRRGQKLITYEFIYLFYSKTVFIGRWESLFFICHWCWEF